MIELTCPARPNTLVTMDFAIVVDVTVEVTPRVDITFEPSIKTTMSVDFGTDNTVDFGATGAEGLQILTLAESVSDPIPDLPRSQN